MSDQLVVHPIKDPSRAAHEVVLELCKAGAFGVGPEAQAMGRGDGEKLAEAIIAVHEKLAAHYKSLGHG
ncbi:MULTISPECIES: hypothetical protein [Halomonas]|uniref:Uncharacterized protein n=1 Tax=Halomonas halophila TaxID=29573 RepID=A0ABQ0U6S1_9GAMM|nr:MULTISPECIES: hypothetical protein [Halomonas]MDR5891124.1 hypothetical protein [Halomonas salina]WJY08412.1 hypothetical protein QWG60_05725 [Halomonas halophila]GEK74213.1 hypothetical protein HHA04nite_27570 [Halomonas halophila]